jgi:hypothetical protein
VENESYNDKLNNSYAKYNGWTRHLAVDEIIVLFKSRVIFTHYMPKKHKRFGINLYKLCGSKGYTYNVYLGKDRKHATPSTATHVTVRGLPARIEHKGHKLYIGSFLSSPSLFDDLHTKTINCCGTVRPVGKGC